MRARSMMMPMMMMMLMMMLVVTSGVDQCLGGYDHESDACQRRRCPSILRVHPPADGLDSNVSTAEWSQSGIVDQFGVMTGFGANQTALEEGEIPVRVVVMMRGMMNLLKMMFTIMTM